MNNDPKVQIMKEAFSAPNPSALTRTTRASTDDALVASWLGTFDAIDSGGTVQLYRRVVRGFLGWMSAESLTLSTLTVEDLVSWREQLKGAAATRANRLAITKSLLGYAHKTGYTRFNVGLAVKAPRVSPDPDARNLTEMQVASMVHVARAALAAEQKRKSPRGRYLRAATQQLHLILWAYYTGCRVSEISQANWEDLHVRNDGDYNLSVLGKGQRRTVVIPQRVVTEVSGGVLTDRTGRVFPVGTRRLQTMISLLAARAGLPNKVSAHWLRHASASHSVDRGAPIHAVQRSLGHASLSTTGRYLHRNQEGAARYLANF